jgi:hypothetical protein
LNKWISLVIIILVLVGLAGFSYRLYMDSYVPYIPIICPSEGDFKEAPQLNTPDFQKSIKFVLNKYYVKWEMKNGKVMIQRKLTIGFENRELLWNYTTKAKALDF